MVGSDRLELSTYGLRVGIQLYLLVLIRTARININQQLTEIDTVIAHSKVLIEIRQFSGNLLTSAVTSWPM